MYGPETAPPNFVAADAKNSNVEHGIVLRREAMTLMGHDGPVLAVRFDASGMYCVSCGKDRTIKLWNPHRGLLIRTYTGHGYDVRDAHISKDKNNFISCGGDRQLFLWDVSTGKVVRKYRGHDGAVNSVAYSKNNETIVSGGDDAAVKVWDCRSRSIDPIQTMRACNDSVMSVMTLKQDSILVGSVDGTVRIFDVRMGKQVVDLVHHPVTCVSATADDGCILAACTDGHIRLLDRREGDLLNVYQGHVHKSTKLDAAFLPSDAHIVSCSEDGRVVYWDVVEGSILGEVQAHNNQIVCSLSVSPQGDCLLTSSVDGTVKLWTN